jgi:hypothetical protein
MSEELQQNPTAQPQEAAQQESNDLNVNDLNGMKTIIDIASSRGAFKPNEMVAVGQIYNKLSNFLASVSKQPPAPGA